MSDAKKRQPRQPKEPYRCGWCDKCRALMDCEDPPIPLEHVRKKSGFAYKSEGGSTFWIRYSTYGVRYQCRYCGKEALGIGGGPRHNHWPDCPLQAKREQVAAARKAMELEEAEAP